MARAKQNVWPFTKRASAPAKAARRSSMTIGQATRAAFKEQGQQSGDTGLFQSWLDSQGLSGRGNVLRARLSKEYERGVIQGEGPSRGQTTRRTTSAGTEYKGRSIKLAEGGGYVIPSIDKESVFDSLDDAKRFIDSWGRRTRRGAT